ncbi:bifunctional diguanylate cyclase/phosphodiesterase [Cognatiluteimonas profundi]|uniref:bifunctional diguanylate cyclase/phosphodiesterase n=1 Tax=Cognatiluteimonas profundi TaxID=2594501 RepID=UPI00131BBEF1|nr:EAL domain-containing protein [Lysobacter profundi]
MWALIGLLLGIVATGSVLLLERHNLQAEAHLRLAAIAKRSTYQIERQFESSGLLLRAMQSAYYVSGDIDQQLFAAMHGNLRPKLLAPSVVALGFAPRMAGNNPGAPPRYPYERVAPLAGNAQLLGLDVARQAANLRALERARDIDEPVMSSAFPLLQATSEPGDALGVVVRLPAFTPGTVPVDTPDRRRRELGSLGLSMRVQPLLLSALPTDALRDFRVHVDDITTGKPQLLYDTDAKVLPDVAAYVGVLTFGERRWRLTMQPRADGYDASLLWMIGLGGAIASLLLASLFWSIANTRRRAVDIGRQMSARYRESEERFRKLNDLLPALVLMARAEDGHVLYANQAACARLGEHIDAGASLGVLFEDETLQRRLLEPGLDVWCNVDAVLKTLNGDKFWASTSISRVRVGRREKLLMVATDISEQRQLTELLSYQASHDTLTELYNRREFERRVQRALFGVGKGEQACALVYIDLDQFKLINDTSGHLAGDQLLSQLALVMAEQLRGGDILARLGGDEFGILAHEITHEGAQALAERLRSRVEGYIYIWEQRSYTISASLGVVMLDRPGLTLADVLSHADSACYMAKDRGRNRIHFYSEQADETIRRRGEMDWANRLRWVIEEGRLLLDYQEVQPLQGQPDEDPHIELLIRLRDEEGNVVLPGAFLPAAERYGMMALLDRWVVGEAIAHFDQLHVSGRAPGRCSLNLAASTLEDDDLADYLLDLIERHGVSPSRLCFEITETEAVRNLARAVRFIERLRSVGCQVALDDFGAGMSSFGYLKNLPVDVIKIDGSFIRDLDDDPMNRSIVNAITTIGHQRGMDVVAEWVSSQANADTLRSLGVDYGQGFALHRPERVLYQRVLEHVPAIAR